MGVDLDAAALAELDARVLGEPDRRAHARGEDHEVGGDVDARVELDRDAVGAVRVGQRLEGGGGRGQVQR